MTGFVIGVVLMAVLYFAGPTWIRNTAKSLRGVLRGDYHIPPVAFAPMVSLWWVIGCHLSNPNNMIEEHGRTINNMVGDFMLMSLLIAIAISLCVFLSVALNTEDWGKACKATSKLWIPQKKQSESQEVNASEED